MEFEEIQEEIVDKIAANDDVPVYSDRLVISSAEPTIRHRFSSVMSLYVRAGSIGVYIDDEEISVYSHTGIVISPNVPFRLKTIGNGQAEIEVVIFHSSSIFGYGKTRLSSKFKDIINDESMKYVLFNCRREPGTAISRCMDNIYYISREKPFAYEIAQRGYLAEMWFYIIGKCNRGPAFEKSTRFSNDEYRVKMAVNYIEQHYAEQITLDDIASNIHISRSECCRCFKRVVGLTPIEYVVQYRIFTAASMLDNPYVDVPNISEIALSTGHNNISYFNKMFKKYMDTTPTQYRKDVIARGTKIPERR